MKKELVGLTKLLPCIEGLEYARSKPSLDVAWDECPEPAWLLWYVRKKFLIEKTNSVKIACFAARQALPIFETARPNDNRPRAAIKAAEAWWKNPTEENREAAAAAAYAAAAAAYAADAAYAAAAAASYAAAVAASVAADDAAAYAAAAAAASAAALKTISKTTFTNDFTKLLLNFLLDFINNN